MQAGTLLLSSPLLAGDYFEQCVVLLCEHHPVRGSIGYVVNKPYHRPLNQLQQFAHAPALPLYQGGPVQTDMLYLLHRSPQHIPGGTLIVPGLYNGGSIEQAVRQLNAGQILPRHLRCLLGYCGWDAGELDAEIAEGSWLISTATWQVAFEEMAIPPQQLWAHLRQQLQ